jgi:Acyl-coenzyme A:6-aminopenicillanic acid acyl-transferase
MSDMAVRVIERRLGTVPWLVVRGPAAEAFTSLGAHLRSQIAEVIEGLPDLAALRRHVAREPGRHRLAAVRQATQSRFPQAWAELAALAAGAGVPLDDLALLNFRGDLGVIEPDTADAGTGCSDLAWRRQRSFIAHNEDEPDFFTGRCVLLTLALDDRQPVATFAKPGFLPSSTFTVTGPGLVWGIDHMQAGSPGPGAGRHFVARGLQLMAGTVDQAIGYLRGHPSAGGFAYTIGDRAGRIVAVESSAGQHAWREIGADGPIGWHTNHGRYIADAAASPHGTSLQRGKVLAALDIPAFEPEPGWFVRVLASPPPDGVRAEPSDAGRATTLCTFVADLTGGGATIVGQNTEPVTVPLSSLTHP